LTFFVEFLIYVDCLFVMVVTIVGVWRRCMQRLHIVINNNITIIITFFFFNYWF